MALDLAGAEFAILALVCWCLVHYYRGPLVTLDVTITVYISWVMGFASVLLLPIDLSMALQDQSHSRGLVDLWYVVYWSTFFLAWVVLPVQMEYHSSGHFHFWGKLLDAFRKLLLALALALVAGVIYIIYMSATGGGSASHMLAFMMAMGNTYGVLLITVLMGSGLVALPKRLWTMADSEAELCRLYISAQTIDDAYHEARYELEDCELEVQKAVNLVNDRGNSLSSEIQKYISILHEKVQKFNFQNRSSSRAFATSHTVSTEVKDYSVKPTLVALHASLIQAQLKVRAAEQRWKVLISNCIKNQQLQHGGAVAASQVDPSAGVVSAWVLMPIATACKAEEDSVLAKILRNVNLCCGGLHALWMKHCYDIACRFAAVVLGVCSVFILWSEMVMASSLHSPIGYLLGAYDATLPNPVIIQGIAFVVLAYMSVCTYWTLFRINIGWSYRLQGPQLSAPSSLIFNAEYLSRLQFALSYNFLLCLNISR